MPKEDIVFPENLFRTIDDVHDKATTEFKNINSEAKELASRRNEVNAAKNKEAMKEQVASSGKKLSL